jgi:hypothetical protein
MENVVLTVRRKVLGDPRGLVLEKLFEQEGLVWRTR